MNKDKLGILKRFVHFTIENAKVLCSDKSTMAEKIFARHSQGMNVNGTIFQMQQLNKPKFADGGIVDGGGCDLDVVLSRDINPPPFPKMDEASNSITIKIDTISEEDLYKKISDMVKFR